jgi:hypothetical protein
MEANFFFISSIYGREDAILQFFDVSQTKNSGSLCTAGFLTNGRWYTIRFSVYCIIMSVQNYLFVFARCRGIGESWVPSSTKDR